nr:MAG TPA: hypothetical protein [Caudoviricetes sp.]
MIFFHKMLIILAIVCYGGSKLNPLVEPRHHILVRGFHLSRH